MCGMCDVCLCVFLCVHVCLTDVCVVCDMCDMCEVCYVYDVCVGACTFVCV